MYLQSAARGKNTITVDEAAALKSLDGIS